MTNAERRDLLTQTKQAQSQGFEGSVLDVFQNPTSLQQFAAERAQQEQQQQLAQPGGMEVANTPEQMEQGLRGRELQQAPNKMVFPNVPANTPFNTVGMKFPIDIEKRDEMGHLVESHQNVPPGLVNIGTGPRKGTVIESPAQKQGGGPIKHNQDGPRTPELTDAEMSLKILQEANAGNPAARRMRSDYGQRLGNKTHFMASMDREAVPLVQEEYIGGPLRESNNPPPSSSDFRFDTPRQADYFSTNYKRATAAKTFNKRQTGGIAKAQGGLPRDYSLDPKLTTAAPDTTSVATPAGAVSAVADFTEAEREGTSISEYIGNKKRTEVAKQHGDYLDHKKNIRDYVSDYTAIHEPNLPQEEVEKRITGYEQGRGLRQYMDNRTNYSSDVFSTASQDKSVYLDAGKGTLLSTDPSRREKEIAFAKKYNLQPGKLKPMAAVTAPFSTAYQSNQGRRTSQAQLNERIANTPGVLKIADFAAPIPPILHGTKAAQLALKAYGTTNKYAKVASNVWDATKFKGEYFKPLNRALEQVVPDIKKYGISMYKPRKYVRDNFIKKPFRSAVTNPEGKIPEREITYMNL